MPNLYEFFLQLSNKIVAEKGVIAQIIPDRFGYNYSSKIIRDHFLKNNWIPHKNNPVVIDTLKGRNGGLIIDDLDIYRVFQSQGFNKYGESIGLAKISKLTKTYYREDDKFKIKPNFFSNIEGTHTFNYHEGLLVIDYLKTDK